MDYKLLYAGINPESYGQMNFNAEWNPNAEYNFNKYTSATTHVVNYNGGLYVLIADPSGLPPDKDPNAWALVATTGNESLGMFKGFYDASTNTPTLTNGVGEAGDYYITKVPGNATPSGEYANVNDTVACNDVLLWEVGSSVTNSDSIVISNNYTIIEGSEVEVGQTVTQAFGAVQGEIDNLTVTKASLVTNPTAGDILSVNAQGQPIDSQVSLTSVTSQLTNNTQEIASLKSRVTGVEIATNQNTQNISTLNSRVTLVENTTNQNKQDITTLTTQLNNKQNLVQGGASGNVLVNSSTGQAVDSQIQLSNLALKANVVSSISRDTPVEGDIVFTGAVTQTGNTFNFTGGGGGGGGATKLVVTSSNNTITQVGSSTYDAQTETLTVDLEATGSGDGVTSVTSANSDISVANSTTTPLLTLNSSVNGLADKIVKLDNTGALGSINIGTNGTVNAGGAYTGTLNQVLTDIVGDIGLPIATTVTLGGAYYPTAGALNITEQGAVSVNVDNVTIKIVNNQLVAQSSGNSLDGITQSATPFLTALGSGASKTATGLNNTFIGANAGKLVTTGPNNTAVGTDAIATLTTGAYNTAVGDGAGQLMTLGSNNAIFGQDAMKSSVNVSGNTAIGAQAGEILSGSNNVIIGFQSGDLITNTTNAVCIGSQAGGAWNNGANGTVAVGYASLNNLTSGANNCAVGFYAGSNISTGANNTALGQSAMRGVSTTNNSTAVGFSALNVSTGANNTALGAYAGDKATTGINNVFVGSTAGTGITTGTNNTFIGAGAGSSVITGSNNTIIGRYVGNGALESNVVLSDGGGNIKLMINNANAWGITGASLDWGLENQTITSGGGNGNPVKWTYKNSNVTQSITANTTVTAGKGVTFINATSGNVTATLPTASGNTGLSLILKRTDTSSNTVTIASAGGAIEGNATKTLPALATVTLTSNGSAWFITSTNETTTPPPPASGGTYAVADDYLFGQSLSVSGAFNFNQANSKAVSGCSITDNGIVLLPNRTYQFNMMLPVKTNGQPELNTFMLQYTGGANTPPIYALNTDNVNIVRGTIDNNTFTANAGDGQAQSKGYAITGALTQYTPGATIYPYQGCIGNTLTTPTTWCLYTRIGVPDKVLYQASGSINFLIPGSKTSVGSADLGTNTNLWTAFTNPVGPSGTYFNGGSAINDKYTVLYFNGNQTSVYFKTYNGPSWIATPAQATQVNCGSGNSGLSGNTFLTFASNKTGYRFNLDSNTALALTLPNENANVFFKDVADGYIGNDLGFAISNNATSTWDTIYTLANNSTTINSVATNIKAIVPQATQMGNIVYNEMDKYWYAIVWDYDNNNSYVLRSTVIKSVSNWQLIQTLNGTLYGNLTYANTRGVNLNGSMMVATKISKSGVEANTTVCSINGGQFNTISNDLTLRGVVPTAHPSGVIVLSSGESTQSYKFSYDGSTWFNGTAPSNVQGYMIPCQLGFIRINAAYGWQYVTSAVLTVISGVPLNLIPDKIWLGGQYITSVFGSAQQHQITNYVANGNGMNVATNTIQIPGNNIFTNIQTGIAGLNAGEKATNLYATMLTLINSVRVTANVTSGSTLTSVAQYAIAQNDRIALSGLVVTGANSATLSVNYDFAIAPVAVLAGTTMNVTEV